MVNYFTSFNELANARLLIINEAFVDFSIDVTNLIISTASEREQLKRLSNSIKGKKNKQIATAQSIKRLIVHAPEQLNSSSCLTYLKAKVYRVPSGAFPHNHLFRRGKTALLR